MISIVPHIIPAIYLAAAAPRPPPPPPPPPNSPVYQGRSAPPAPESADSGGPSSTLGWLADAAESEETDNSEEPAKSDADVVDDYWNASRKVRRRDWYIYHAYLACTEENDYDKCARYAEAASALDERDETADQLYAIAVRQGGQGKKKRWRRRSGASRLGPERSHHRIGLGAVVLLYQPAHSGYLITPEYVFEFKNRYLAFMQLGGGPLVGELTFFRPTTPDEDTQPWTPTPAGNTVTALTAGIRIRFQIGVQFDVGRRGLIRLHAGMSGGIIGAKLVRDETSLFLQALPEAGLAFHLGRFGLGVAAVGSGLFAGDDNTPSQAFGLGFLPKFSVGFGS